MKILVCTQEYPPKGSGIGNVAKYVVDELQKKGHDITVLSANTGDIQLNFEKKINRFAGIGLILFWKKVRKYIQKNSNKYDIIWTHNPMFIQKINDDKIYSTVHTTYVTYFDIYKKMKYKFFVKTYYFIMKYIEKYIYKKNKFKTNIISPEVIKELINLGLKKNKIQYIPNGVNTTKFKPYKRKWLPLKIPEDYKVLLCVGRVTYQKNPFGLLDIMKKIQESREKISLIWAGRGELLEEARKYIKENKISNTYLIGNVNHDKLPQIYSSADAYILLSFYEGQPLTLLEAMSCGTPGIVSTIPNMTHLIKDAKSGTIVNMNNKNESAERIIKYLNSDKLQKDGLNARIYAEKNLDWKIITEKYLEKWNKIIGEK